MTTSKSVKIVSVISLASIGMWLLAVALIHTLQDSIAASFIMTSFVGENEQIFLASDVVHIISAAVIAACNILMIYGKTKLVPLILSGCAFLIDPLVSTVAHNLQTVLAARLQGEYALARIGALTTFSGYASNILNIAFFCTIAASAVYGYAKKKGLYNENT
ncbi:MAG: hypothetical protein IKK42_00725 [Oscillospiraceae bacterium]|nr:hypothetical protein [Oscillospiraceae bacterium]